MKKSSLPLAPLRGFGLDFSSGSVFFCQAGNVSLGVDTIFCNQCLWAQVLFEEIQIKTTLSISYPSIICASVR